MMINSKHILLLGILTILIPLNSQVVINEVMARPTDEAPCPNNPTTGNPTCQGMINDGREYVELYNPTCADIDLTDFILASRSKVFTNDYGGSFRFPEGTVIG